MLRSKKEVNMSGVEGPRLRIKGREVNRREEGVTSQWGLRGHRKEPRGDYIREKGCDPSAQDHSALCVVGEP